MKNNVRIVDFEPEHFSTIRLRMEDAADLDGIDTAWLLSGWAGGRTVLKNGEPAFFYGYRAIYGTICMWAVSSPLVDSMPLLITRLGKSGIREMFKAGAHRIEVYCHIGNTRSLAWLTRCLGFRLEGLMRRTGPNRQDRFLLALTDIDYREDTTWAV